MNLMAETPAPTPKESGIKPEDLLGRKDKYTGNQPEREHESPKDRWIKVNPEAYHAFQSIQKKSENRVRLLEEKKAKEGKLSDEDQLTLEALTRVAGISSIKKPFAEDYQIQESALIDVVAAGYFFEKELKQKQETQEEAAKKGPRGLMEVEYKKFVALEQSLLVRQRAGENVTAELARVQADKLARATLLSQLQQTEPATFKAFLAIEDDKIARLRAQAWQLDEEATRVRNNTQILVQQAESATKLFKEQKSPQLTAAEQRLEKANQDAKAALETKDKAKKALDEAVDRQTKLPGLITAATAEETDTVTRTQKVIDTIDQKITDLEAAFSTAKSQEKPDINAEISVAKAERAAVRDERIAAAKKISDLQQENSTIGQKITKLTSEVSDADTLIKQVGKELGAATVALRGAKTPDDDRLERGAVDAKAKADKSQKEMREAEEKVAKVKAEKTEAEREYSLYKNEIAAIEKAYTERDQLARDIASSRAETDLIHLMLINSRTVFEQNFFGSRKIDAPATARAITELGIHLEEIKQAPLYELVASYNLQKKREEITAQPAGGERAKPGKETPSSPAVPDLKPYRDILEKPENLPALQQLAKDYQSATTPDDQKRLVNEAAGSLKIPVDMLLMILWVVLGEVGKSIKT